MKHRRNWIFAIIFIFLLFVSAFYIFLNSNSDKSKDVALSHHNPNHPDYLNRDEIDFWRKMHENNDAK